MKLLSILLLGMILLGCKEKESSIVQEEPITAQVIVDKAIAHSCNGRCDNVKIDFTFRDVCYVSKRYFSQFQLERIISDQNGVTHDILTNDGFQRFRNDTVVKVPDSMVTKYSNSVNSVHYFAQLPFGLNAEAAKKTLLGEATIKGQPYYEIGVSFSKEGGGTDFEDTFVYWIHKEKFTTDYIAYDYATDGGGKRFREAYNERIVEGIRFVDYNNYKPQDLNTPLTQLDELFETGKLSLLSKIETESVGVELPAADENI